MSTCISSSGCLLSFCSLGRGEEGREAGGEVLSVAPTMLPAPWLNFHWPWAAPTQLGEPPGPVPGRQADAAGWLAHAHCREAACPAEMAMGEGGSYLFIPLPSLVYLLHLSEGRQAGPYWQSGRVPSRTGAQGHRPI